MSGFFSKIFGLNNKEGHSEADTPARLIEDVLEEVIYIAELDLDFDIRTIDEKGKEILEIDLFGADEELLFDKDGALLDAFQLYLKRVVQHQMEESSIILRIDSKGFREDVEKRLVEMVDKSVERVLSEGKSTYLKAMAPKDRRVVHQYLAANGRVKSRSVGDGHFKRVKVYAIRQESGEAEMNE